jgi:hypothetical protein
MCIRDSGNSNQDGIYLLNWKEVFELAGLEDLLTYLSSK